MIGKALFERDFYRRNFFIILFVFLQFGLWMNTRQIKPDLSIVPEVPSYNTVMALSLGDTQFYFRVLGTEIQNSGDSFGRFTALKSYNYDKLSKWFYLLDRLDPESSYMPALAAYYYSNTQYRPDTRYMIDYLVNHSERNLEKNWWWLFQAVYIAKYKLKDNKLAIDLAYKLAAIPNIPLWATQMPAYLLLDEGETEAAGKIVTSILDNYDNLPEDQKKLMYYFLNERIKKAKETAKMRENAGKPEEN